MLQKLPQVWKVKHPHKRSLPGFVEVSGAALRVPAPLCHLQHLSGRGTLPPRVSLASKGPDLLLDEGTLPTQPGSC